MFELPPLPYDHAALEPVISRATMDVHHGKHHKKYIDTLNALLAKAGGLSESLENVVRGAAGDDADTKLFNNAAQAWNHTFFWTAMSARRQAPDGVLVEAIARDFGGLEALKAAFVAEGNAHFGSGWAWLVHDGSKLEVTSTHDADLPLAHGQRALLTIDVWEHAYYVDYRNKRPDYLTAFLDHLVNWDFVGKGFDLG